MSTSGKKRNKREAKKKGLRIRSNTDLDHTIKRQCMNVAKLRYGSGAMSEEGIKNVEATNYCQVCDMWWSVNECPLCGNSKLRSY